MSEIGDQLRSAREAKNLTLAQVERATRIKARYLQAMEEGRWDDLPGAVQARGFLKNYASFLELDSEELVVLRERELAKPVPEILPQPAAPVVQSPQSPASPQPVIAPSPVASQSPEPAPSMVAALETPSAQTAPPEPSEQFVTPRWLSIDMIVGGVALVLFAVIAILAARSYVLPLISKLNEPTPEPTSVAGTRLPVTLTPTRVITPTAVFPVNPDGGIQIGLAALEHAWVRITTDGMTAFEGLLIPGQSLTWDAKEQLIVETGDGAAFNFAINGKTMGALGKRNQVTIRAWSPRGEVVAPPTPSPAPPTETPEPAPTLAPLPTP